MNSLDLPLIFDKGTTRVDWENDIHPMIKSLFEKEVYGTVPIPKIEPKYTLKKEVDGALGGKSVRREVTIDFDVKKINLIYYIPKGMMCRGIFTGLNFRGNHTVTHEIDVDITTDSDDIKSTELRGNQASRWPIESIIDRGYGVATAHYGDFFMDNSNDYEDRQVKFAKDIKSDDKKPSAIGIWALMLIEMAKYIKKQESYKDIPLIVFGHSRLGKTAIVAGVNSAQFDMVISNDSGCGGAAIFKRGVGETISVINTSFPHWFNDKFKSYNDKDGKLHFDQHMLLSLIAPRPLYVASASEDTWADPEGEFLSAKLAQQAYKLYGYDVVLDSFPEVNTTVGDRVRYHVRDGVHDITEYDFECYMDMADEVFNR